MVKTLSAFFLLLLIAAPAMAQDDYPRVEMGMGYANYSLPGATASSTQHRSGFAMQTGFNLKKSVGVDYYLGYYSLGSGSQLFSNVFSAKLMARTDKITPFVLAGIGGSQVSQQSGGSYYSSGSALTTRMGGGIDYKLTDGMSWRVDVSKMQFHTRDAANKKVWVGNMNFATGIVITLMQ